MDRSFLHRILSQISVSGYEEPVQKVVCDHMGAYSDEIRTDEMGNVICIANPESSVKIMLSAHADEIGLMVTRITDNGRIQVIERGGIIPQTYPGQRVQICTDSGIVYGVVEVYRKLFQKEELKATDFLIDIGASTKEEAQKYVALGNPVVLDSAIRELVSDKITARALDDRIGVFIIMEALKRAREKGCKVGVYAAATVGEETTKTGAYWTSTRIKPSLAIVVDVTYCSDCSGMNPAEMGDVTLGGGPVLCNSPIVVKKLNQKMEECAKKIGIKTQREAASRLTYTDGDKIHFSNQGVPMVLVSIPLRYMHSPGEVADMKDVEGCIELIAEFLATAEV